MCQVHTTEVELEHVGAHGDQIVGDVKVVVLIRDRKSCLPVKGLLQRSTSQYQSGHQLQITHASSGNQGCNTQNRIRQGKGKGKGNVKDKSDTNKDKDKADPR